MNIYIDGSCKGNPGPAGAAAYVEKECVKYKFIGEATNNIAELEALKLAVKYLYVNNVEDPVNITTDSQLIIGLFTQNWKPKHNTELIQEIKDIIDLLLCELTFKKVKGHTGNPGNEKADMYAKLAITELSSGSISFRDKLVCINDIISKAEEVEQERSWLKFRELIDMIKEFKND